MEQFPIVQKSALRLNLTMEEMNRSENEGIVLGISEYR